MLKTARILWQTKLITPSGLYSLARSVLASGVNLGALLRFAAKRYPERIAVNDGTVSVTYKTLYAETDKLTRYLAANYKISGGKKVALICRNRCLMIRTIFAISSTGADLYLLSTDMSAAQTDALATQHAFDLVLHDDEFSAHLSQFPGNRASLSDLQDAPVAPYRKTGNRSAGQIIVLTGGTTGQRKTAGRKTSAGAFLYPFSTLLSRLELQTFRSVYIATPIYHGFGVATLIMSAVLGTTIFVTEKFDRRTACDLVRMHRIEVITLVPLMLQRMISHDTTALVTLKCIISGGAALDPKLAGHTISALGPVLYNLYGTSEAGVAVIACPQDMTNAAGTIGKPVAGCDVSIRGNNGHTLPDNIPGRICIRSKWTARNADNRWVDTGDIGYRDSFGYYFLKGRADDMIVSGGENVYPSDLENILLLHHEIRHAAVIGVPNEEFGQRLKAFIGSALICGEL